MDYSKRLENRWYIIYIITNLFDSDSYIGCTYNTITQRFNQHVAKSKRSDTNLARKIRDVGRENMMIVDLVSRWMSQIEAHRIEWEVIDLLEPSLNMRSTGKFYDDDGSFNQRDYDKIGNSVKIPCDCGGSYTPSNKTNHIRTQRHLSSVSVFSSLPCSPPHPTMPVVNPEDSACHSD